MATLTANLADSSGFLGHVVTQTPYTVGVIDDDVSVRSALRRLFRTAGFNVVLFATAEEYLTSQTRTEIDCLAIDICLPGMGGLELLETTRAQDATPALIITGPENADARPRAMAAGAIGFFLKPFDNHSLLATVGTATGVTNSDSTITRPDSQTDGC